MAIIKKHYNVKTTEPKDTCRLCHFEERLVSPICSTCADHQYFVLKGMTIEEED